MNPLAPGSYYPAVHAANPTGVLRPGEIDLIKAHRLRNPEFARAFDRFARRRKRAAWRAKLVSILPIPRWG